MLAVVAPSESQPTGQSTLAEPSVAPDDAYAHARATGGALLELMRAASRVRDRGKGRVVGYSRKVFLPLVRLCRNRCGYCRFSRPGRGEALLMDPDAVLATAGAGAAKGCKEALFCLGERAEDRYPAIRKALAALGHSGTVSYLVAMCDLVWHETGLLPHFNCGVVETDELATLREVSLSGGLMLESASERLSAPGGPHHGSPGKWPQQRLATIAAAGRLSIAYSTGILIGIGETPDERVEALLAIRELHRDYGHIQEVIVQNFQPHAGTPMARAAAPDTIDLLRTIALARLVLGPGMNVQAPPNLGASVYQLYLLAGANDWGGISPVTKDEINPAAAWPDLSDLRRRTESAGFELRERLAIYPELARRPDFVAPRFRPAIERLLASDGFVRAGL